jgi:uncharacterized membrane protein (Fun14 family)
MADFGQVALQVAGSSGLVSSLLTSMGPLLPQIGSGAAVGYVGGWLAKKALKIVMYVAAIFLGLIGAGIAYAESQGWVTVTVHWNAISASTQGLIASATSSLGTLSSVLASVTAFSGTAAAMFVLGFNKA